MAIVINGVDVLGKARDIFVDRLTRALAVMTTDHTYIHEGIAYTAVNFYTALANNGVAYMQIKTPATGRTLHFKPASVSGDGKAELRLWSVTSITDGTTSVLPANRNRRSSQVATAQVFSNPTAVVVNQLLDGAILPGGGAGGSRVGGSVNSAEEFVLDAGKSYVVAITNISGAASNYCVSAFWYEEDGY